MRAWRAPREWVGERCFILCGGASLSAQRHLVPRLKGRMIAVKQSVRLKPDADVMFVAGRDDAWVCKPFFEEFTGERIISRKAHPGLPEQVLTMERALPADRLSREPCALAGLDAGTSAINLAFLLGASEIVLLGYDMCGGRWFNGEIEHHLPVPPQAHHDRHLAAAAGIARDLRDAGVRVWNASPTSAATMFRYRPLEAFLDADQ